MYVCTRLQCRVGYNFASRNQKKKNCQNCQESSFESESLGRYVSRWGVKSRRRTGDGYLTNFAAPSSKRVRGRWKERRRDRKAGMVIECSGS